MQRFHGWRLLLAAIVLVGGPLNARTAAAAFQPSILPGDMLLWMEGGIAFPFGGAFQAEQDLNPLHFSVLYEDGTVMNSSMSHLGMPLGGVFEYIAAERMGVQLGLSTRTYTQTVSAGGGDYEEVEYAKANLMDLTYPFVGATFYLVNWPSWHLYAVGRAGWIAAGRLRPEATTYTYVGISPPVVDLSGFNLGAGLGGAVMLGRYFFVGASCLYTHHFVQTPVKVYPQLDSAFQFGVVDLNAYVGIRF